MRCKIVGLLAVAFSLGVAQAAWAADMPVKGPVYKAPMMAPAYNWTGFYVGVNAGGAWNRSTWSDTANPATYTPFDTNDTSFVAGGHVGYNYQTGQIVLGVEGDLEWLGISGDAQCAAAIGSVCNTKQDWLGSIRGRIGYAGIDRVLVYATGGVAFTRYSFAETALFLQNWGSSSRTGWTVGGGAEYALTNNWIVGLQYSYYDFGTKTSGGGIAPVTVNFKETESTLTARLSYKF